MSKKNIYEVFDDFKAADTKKDRIQVLKNNDTWALRQILVGTFYKEIEFVIKDIPEWKRVDMPPGMSYNNMTQALDKIYLFMKNNPRTPSTLSDKRRNELLIQLLESLEEKEADVYISLLKKDLKIPYLTRSLVDEAFPGLLPSA